MKQCSIDSQKTFHPSLSGLPFDMDETGVTISLRDRPRPIPDPNPQKPRDPRPRQKRDPHPIRRPEIHPPEDRQLPRFAEPAPENAYQKDSSKKPAGSHADWHDIPPHTLQEHLICGYHQNGGKISQLILGSETENGAIRYSGHVPFGEHPLDALIIASQRKTGAHPFSGIAFMSELPTVWIDPDLACIIQCSEKTDSGLMITPLYRGLKSEKPRRRPSDAAIFSAAVQ